MAKCANEGCDRHIVLKDGKCYWCTDSISPEQKFVARSRGGSLGGKNHDPMQISPGRRIETQEDVLELQIENYFAALALANSPRRCDLVDKLLISISDTMLRKDLLSEFTPFQVIDLDG